MTEISQALHLILLKKKSICIKVISSPVKLNIFFSLQHCCFLLSSYSSFWKQLDFHCFLLFFFFCPAFVFRHNADEAASFPVGSGWCCWPSQPPLLAVFFFITCHLSINHASGPYSVPSDRSAHSWFLFLFQAVLVIGMKLLFSQGSIPERK